MLSLSSEANINDMKSQWSASILEGPDFRFVLRPFWSCSSEALGTTHAVISASEAVEGPFIWQTQMITMGHLLLK